MSADEHPPVMGQYVVCGQYPGAVPEGATVHLRCTNTSLPPARYVIVQFPITDHMNFCELDVCAYGKLLFLVFNQSINQSINLFVQKYNTHTGQDTKGGRNLR